MIFGQIEWDEHNLDHATRGGSPQQRSSRRSGMPTECSVTGNTLSGR